MNQKIERNSFLVSTKFKSFSKLIDKQQLLSMAARTQKFEWI